MGQIKETKNVGGIEGLCIIEPAVHGDAYVTIQIEVPKTVTAEERRKLEELERIRQSA